MIPTTTSLSQVKALNASPSLNLAIWETVYQKELKPFWEIAKAKARRIQYLESLDPYSFSEERAKRQFRELQKLNEELNALVGFKNHVEGLKNAYLETSVWLAEYTERQGQYYGHQINQLKKSYDSLNQQFEHAAFWEMRYLEILTKVIAESKQKGYSINALNQIWE